MKKKKDYTLHLLAFCFLLAVLGSMVSCSPSNGIGCKGNRDMLSAGAGRTKFNK